VEDNRVLCEFVEVWYRLYEDRRGGGNAGELARANGLEDGEERVRILTDCEDLETLLATGFSILGQYAAYLRLSLCNNASSIALL
jgi:hypothetical protein